ncbi:MAG TPA: cysteine--tRNA ligase [Candidatus Syntrophosphaera sp.]|jgi:cysteinyl-tRNA synthetase|nr:cysteine--tRNA ligase [Candidatus Syntrophosphaera sp.]HOH48026.1 cysteine--tRNA ligase [Candidatus Syntrophosphaera sp.]HPW38279.1 cysteine--tRNA ligase [Candidatus Syntrophosphaera sp.]HQC46984.1 cysteine--tRNA ligase [Candidatus Syntrophosphaera sp.]
MLLYNTAKRAKEEFVPLTPGQVKMYACGPTVYNYFHIGNARAFLTFDVLRRYFEFRGYKVDYVQNITDIEDKIIAQSLEEGVSYKEVADKYAKAFLEDSASLGIRRPTHQPRATEVLPEIIAAIAALEKSGHAYEVNGDVYFDTASLPEYGQLSGKKTEEQLPGARVLENLQKRNPADFTLWKAGKPGEPVWNSPWGVGRPGWHTECVVMGQKYLGETFDIHGGGADLIFPHHENELAQALALTGKPLARYWMHNGFLNVDGDKMSKSLNNFFTARDILARHSAEAIRFFFLSKHYRSPIDFNREIIEESERAVKNFYAALRDIDYKSISSALDGSYESSEQAFVEAMDDDLNTAKALAVLFDLVRHCKNGQLPRPQREQAALMLVRLGEVLGFFSDLSEKLNTALPDLSRQLVELLLTYRREARENKDWKLSDRIRDDLASLGVELRDTPSGCDWKIKD